MKTKVSIKIKLILPFAFLIIICAFAGSHMVTNIYATGVDVDKSTEIETDYSNKATLKFSRPINNSELFVFKKDEYDNVFYKYNKYDINGTSVELSGESWEEHVNNYYYVVVVDKNRHLNIDNFNNKEAIISRDDGRYILKNGNDELTLNEVIITYVNNPPVINDIRATIQQGWQGSQNLAVTKTGTKWETAWTNNNVKLIINADDKGSGIAGYSFDDGATWTGENNKEFYEAKAVKIKVKDNVGNITSAVVNVNIDRNPPRVEPINNDGTEKIYIKATDGESGIDSIGSYFPSDIGNIRYEKSEIEEDTYIATVSVNQGKSYNAKITFYVKDKAGNITHIETLNNVCVDEEPPRIENISFEKLSGTPDSNTAKIGDKIKVTFGIYSNDDYDKSSVKIKINDCDYNIIPTYNEQLDKYEYEFIIGTEIPEDKFIDNQDIAITYFDCTDSKGNSAADDSIHSAQNPIKYYGPIKVSDVEFKSDNNNPMVAKGNDKVYISFNTNHSVIVNGEIIQDSNVGVDEWVLFSIPNYITGEYDYKGYLTVEDISSFDNQNFKFNFKLTDSAGNEPVLIDETYEDLEPVVYYAPIEDSIVDLKLTSEGANLSCVKDGDSVSLYLKTSHKVSVSNVVVSGRSIEMTSEDNFEWIGSQVIDGSLLSDYSDIEFQLTITDDAGNQSVTRTHNNVEKKVKYYAPISVYDLRMTSNNNINSVSVAKNGNIVETTFKTSHPVKITEGKVGGKKVTFESEDGMNWKGYYTVANGDTVDNGFISLLLKIDDDAENEQLQVTENTSGLQKITYYAPIKVYDVVIKSSNGVDATKYAKNGDVIYVTFKTNHDARITSANIVGKACAQTKNDTSGIEKQWTLTYRINNGDLRDLSVVPFEFKVDDIAGNDPWIQNHTNGVRNRITYYSPITEVTSIASNYRNTDYAKNGDTITVSVRTNHDVSVTESAIFNRAAVNSIVNGNDVRISYTIPQNENGLEQGVVPFRYSLVDPAGNTLTINRTTNTANTVTYDRTRPIVSVTPEFNGFTNKNVSFTFNFSDENLSGNDVSIRVNGVEQISQAERASIGGKTFSKTITLSIENEYEVVATMLDKAGNKCPQDKVAKLTIDKTAPNITSTKIDLTKANNFKSGVKLIDLIDISEEYISEVICTITDSEGTREHDINDPITGDGKKTINLTVKDMAGNVSSTVTFDLYIDGKPPKLVIKNSNSGKQLLSLDKMMTFKSSLKLMIGLDSFENDDTGDLEKFVTLKVVDNKGKVVVDILDDCTPLADGNYCVDIDKHGEFTLEVEAVDSVGNSTGLLKYNFEIKEKTLVEKFVSNKILLIGSISAVVILAAVIVILVVRKKRRYYI